MQISFFVWSLLSHLTFPHLNGNNGFREHFTFPQCDFSLEKKKTRLQALVQALFYIQNICKGSSASVAPHFGING